MNDLRYAVRTLTTARAFTLVAISVLALGIGLNTALYSIVYSVFFRPLPVHEPDRLVYLYWMFGRYQQIGPLRFQSFEHFRDHKEGFTDLTAYWTGVGRVTADGETEQITGQAVIANFFDCLGVKPLLGRTFVPSDDLPATTDGALVISHNLWTRRFNSDPNIVGRRVRFSDWSSEREYTIVGVTGERFKGISGPWTPSQYWMTFGQSGRDPRRTAMHVIGRLAPGVTVAQANSIVATQGETLSNPGSPHRERYLALAANKVRIPSDPTASVVPARLAATMMVVVGIVLLIAAANIAGMLTARGVGRDGEMAVRLVLGASGRRLVRQLLTESLLLSIGGGLLGLIVARSLLDLFRRYTPPQYAVDVVMDPRVLLLTGILCIVVGLAIGIAPALRATRNDLLAALPGSNLGITRRSPTRLRHWVVIPQIGLSLVLLLAAGFHIRSLMKIELANLGYDPSHVTVINSTVRPSPGDQADKPRPAAYAEEAAERSRTFYRRVLAAITAVPGTAGAAITSSLPVNPPNASAWSAVSHEAFLAGDDQGVPAARSSISPGYFRTMGIALTEGRDFDERDSRTSTKVAVVGEALARRLWPGRSAIGRLVGPKNNFPARGEKVEWFEVVGVVDDVDPIVRDRGTIPQIYLTLNQEWQPFAGSVVARVPRGAVGVMQALKEAILGAHALAEVYRVQTMEQIIAAILYPRRLAAAILGASGLIGMFLAGLGLYGVIAYSVAQRVQEIGIRTALGADRRDVEWLVVREGVRILAIGTIAGLALTYAALRLTSRFVALPEMDAGTWIGVPAILASVTLLACYLPARRAARLDPLVALRQL